MSRYLVRAKNAQGKNVAVRVEDENMDSARYRLEIQGYTDIQFVTDDLYSAVKTNAKAEGIEVVEVDPDAELASCEAPSTQEFFSSFLGALRCRWIILAVFAAWSIAGFRGHEWLGLPRFTGLILGILYVLSVTRVVWTGVLFARLMDAYDDCRWEEMQSTARTLKRVSRLGFRLMPNNLLDFYEAKALAGMKHLDEALAIATKYDNEKLMQKWMYELQLAAVYETGNDFDRAIESYQRALMLGPKGGSEYITLAQIYIRRKRDVAKAREALAEAEKKEQVEAAAAFVLFCKGLIALEEDHAEEARQHLEAALYKTEMNRDQPMIRGHRREIKTYLCLALAALGQKALAYSHLDEVIRHLRRADDQDLLARILQAYPEKKSRDT